MDERIEQINELIHKLDSDGLLWPVVFVCIVILLLLLWFLTRGLRLWYWKVNSQVNALKNIDMKLQRLEEGLKSSPAPVVSAASPEPDAPIDILGPAADEQAKKDVGRVGETGMESFEPIIINYDLFKTEKIYTEAELEQLIKD